jgi:outer membrane lipase/esterase
MKSWKILLSAVAAALVVVGCGGGGSTSTTNFTNTKVRVFGDSLADSGTFGYKFTVNNASAGAAPTKVWPELVAAGVGQSVCNFYNATNFTTFNAPTITCTNLAVGGGRVISGAATGGPNAPFSIPNQMATAASLLGATGTFAATELMLIDGGGNDSADLAGAFLGASTPAGFGTYTLFLSALVPDPTLTNVLSIPNTGPAQAGGLYMQALANKFADDITTSLLNKGAKRVVLLNAPAVTNTPRFKLVLQSVAASAGTPTAAAVEAASRGWTQAYNAQLAARLGSDPRVAIVDFFSEFDLQVTPAGAASFGLTNVATPACPVVGADAQGLPDYNFRTCTAAALDALPAIAATWRTYAFSDGFHPTPRGHELLANTVVRALTAKGWL